LKRSLNLLFTVDTEECWQMELFCIMTMLDLIQQHQPLKQFENWNLNFFPAQHTVQICHLITISWDWSKLHYVYNDLCILKRLWIQHTYGFPHNWKHSWQIELGNVDHMCEATGLHWKISLFLCTFCIIKKIKSLILSLTSTHQSLGTSIQLRNKNQIHRHIMKSHFENTGYQPTKLMRGWRW
jgi:hypothetical protein